MKETRSDLQIDGLSDAFSTWLDLFRWVAALAVLVNHVENRLLVRILDIPPPEREWVHYVYAFLSGFGHQAVMVFFVISGFLVGGGLWSELKKHRNIEVPGYFAKRIVRLWVVVFPTLFLVLIFDGLSIVYFGGLRNGLFDADIYDKLSVGSFMCNALFLQTTVCFEYGDDSALWSLYNEFWYYVIWPPLLISLATVWSTSARLLCVIFVVISLFVLTYFQFSGSSLAPYMCIWLMGVLAAMLDKSLTKSPVIAGLTFLALLMIIRLGVRREFAESHQYFRFIIDVLAASAFANLLLSLKCDKNLHGPIGNRIHPRLAAFSFSLYCVHTPILTLYASVLITYCGIGWQMKPDGPLTWLIIVGAIVSCIMGAFGFSRFTEANTARIRRWIFAWLGLRQGTISFHLAK